MTKYNMWALDEFQLNRILPSLVKLNYNQPPKRTVKSTAHGKRPFETTVSFDFEQNVTAMMKVQLYHTDCYPVTGKRECVLHVWDLSGRDNKVMAKRIAEALTRDGILARATTYQKYNVVAFDPGDWLNVDHEIAVVD